MRKLLVFLFLLTCAAWAAETWTSEGSHWTSNAGVAFDAPAGSKVQPRSDGTLSILGPGNVNLSLQSTSDKASAETFVKSAEQKFGAHFGEAETSKQGELTVTRYHGLSGKQKGAVAGAGYFHKRKSYFVYVVYYPKASQANFDRWLGEFSASLRLR